MTLSFSPRESVCKSACCKRPINHAIDFSNKVAAVYEVFGSTSCQGINASKSSTVLTRGN
jgi:hypothetical protein